jgi:CelD/BcsL family acetyltransferase involved in cellulose biosynthesis
VQRESSPVLPISGRSWEEFLAGQSRNFREQAGRRARRLAREHSSSLRLIDAPAELERALEALFSLHALRWRDGDSAAFSAELQAFHRDFAQTALARGWLRLWLLEIDEQPVAAWYGFRYGAAESFYQAGRDPAWDAWSVGFVLLVQTMKAAFEDGLQEYRLLRGGEDYKSRFATEDLGLRSIVAAGSRIGKPAAALAARARMLPAPLRRRLTREP